MKIGCEKLKADHPKVNNLKAMDSKLLRNQIISDMVMLGDDYKAGLYEENPVDLIKELMRIYEKMAGYLKQEVQGEFGREQELADATKYGETIKNQKKIIEMWDEDRGWICSCGNCGKSLSPDSGENGKICPFCYVEWKGKIRV